MISESHVKVHLRCSDAPLHIAKIDYLAIQTKVKKKSNKIRKNIIVRVLVCFVWVHVSVLCV
jgi:hypothetical protein